LRLGGEENNRVGRGVSWTKGFKKKFRGGGKSTTMNLCVRRGRANPRSTRNSRYHNRTVKEKKKDSIKKKKKGGEEKEILGTAGIY